MCATGYTCVCVSEREATCRRSRKIKSETQYDECNWSQMCVCVCVGVLSSQHSAGVLSLLFGDPPASLITCYLGNSGLPRACVLCVCTCAWAGVWVWIMTHPAQFRVAILTLLSGEHPPASVTSLSVCLSSCRSISRPPSSSPIFPSSFPGWCPHFMAALVGV